MSRIAGETQARRPEAAPFTPAEFADQVERSLAWLRGYWLPEETLATAGELRRIAGELARRDGGPGA